MDISRYQEGVDGPLKKSVRDRISRFRSLYTLAQIGKALGFSGVFTGALLNEKAPARVRSRHVRRIIEVLEAAEKEEGFKPGKERGSKDLSRVPVEDLVGALNARGLAVTLTPLRSKSR